MKIYYEFQDEITKDEIFKGLLGFGLFAEKIPNFLTSEAFYEYIKNKKFPYNDIKPTDYIRYSNMRNINIPRPLSIPEPFSYANQTKIISDNWSRIVGHFKKKTKSQLFKISRIHLRKLKNNNSLFEMNYKNFSTDGNPEDEIFINSKYISNADIATCFPSIYSHSISWALVGKSIAKKESGRIHEKKWFNQLDFYTRNLKFGETNGVLIGPHSSNLISEIILCCIDYELAKKKYKFYRNVDDYTCFTNSYEEAERFFIDLSETLKGFELLLNSKKSVINKLPQASVSNWVTKLNHFNFSDLYQTKTGKSGVKLKELRGFIDFSIETMLENKNDAAILNYAIKIISNKHLGDFAYNYFIKKIHHLTLLYPYLVLILEKSVFEKHNVEKERIVLLANDLYDLGQKKKNYEICAYAIYFAVKYKFKLHFNDSIKKNSIKSNDCIFMLIAFLYDKRNQKKSYLKEYNDIAIKLLREDFHRYWLFCFEVLTQNELKDKYKELKNAKITFIKKEFI